MQGTFHWLRVNVFCYATEDEALIHDSMAELLGMDEFECDIVESEHGNRLIIFSIEITKQRMVDVIFKNLGVEIWMEILSFVEEMIDDDCVFYMRLDKQDLVQGGYTIAHHGDVLSLTGKVVSHPARKEIAVRNLSDYLTHLD